MLRVLLAKGIMFVLVGVGFLPLSLFMRQELTTSVGGTPTGKVFVPENSEAARRGYALPGEGTGPANFIGGQYNRAAKVRTWSAVAIVVGVAMATIALVARRMRSVDVGTTKSVIAIFGRTLANSFGALFAGAFGAFLTFAPLKALPDSGFDAVFVLLCAASILVVLLKKIDVSRLIG